MWTFVAYLSCFLVLSIVVFGFGLIFLVLAPLIWGFFASIHSLFEAPYEDFGGYHELMVERELERIQDLGHNYEEEDSLYRGQPRYRSIDQRSAG